MGAAPTTATVELLRTLIGFPTVSRDSNLGLIEWARDRLQALGAQPRLTYDAKGGKANLFATLGESDGAGLVLSGHTDVVPVDGQSWSSDPFVLREDDGRLYGRGTADMKGFLAVVLALAPELAARRGEPIHVAFSYDEEIGCVGVRNLLADLEAADIRPRGCIIGEPTDMDVIVGHKSGSAFTCDVRGREAHAALSPHGVNAIEYAARLVVKIREIGDRLAVEERRHAGFEIPHTTMMTGVIHGGIAGNIVPRDCSFRFGIRALPWTRPADILAEIEAFAQEVLVPDMQRVAPEAAITIRQSGDVPGLDTDADAPLTRYVQLLLAGSNRAPGYVAFGTEGGLFARAGIPAIVCGPGSIEQAHRPDEFVSLQQLARCEQFLRALSVAPDFA